MEIKLDSVLTGRILAGVVIFLAVVSAIVGAAGARSGGFDLFLARLALPLGVGILIIAATEVLKVAQDRRGAAGVASARARGDGAEGRARTATSNPAGEAARAAALQGLGMLNANLRLNTGNIGASVRACSRSSASSSTGSPWPHSMAPIWKRGRVLPSGR